MAVIRIPVIAGVAGRSSAVTKDSRMVNAYPEKAKSGKIYAVKRAGLGSLFAHAGTVGQGVHTRTGTYSIVDGVMLKEGTATTYTLAVDTEPYQFLTMPEGILAGFLLKSKNKLYQFTE